MSIFLIHAAKGYETTPPVVGYNPLPEDLRKRLTYTKANLHMNPLNTQEGWMKWDIRLRAAVALVLQVRGYSSNNSARSTNRHVPKSATLRTIQR